jgi:hypothetical protein
MRRTLVVALFFLTLASNALAEKRRAVGPSTDRCVFGVIAADVFVDNIAIDATHVYYLDSFENELFRVPKNGGTVTRLAQFAEDFVIDINVDDTNVYVSTIPLVFGPTFLPGSIYAVAKTGGAARTLASGVPFPVKVLSDATHVYWVAVGTVDLEDEEVLPDGKIERVRKDGTDRQTLAGPLSAPLSLALDETHVYFSESGEATGNTNHGLRRVAKSGGAVQILDNTTIAAEMELAGSELVFFGGSSTNDDVGIFRTPKTGGARTIIVLDEFVFAGPRVIGGQVYYATIPEDPELIDAIMRVPLTGGTPQVLVFPELTGEDFEVDSCGVVFGNQFGELRRVEP